jgi:hypothetical protein
MSQVLLISENKIKAFTALHQNVRMEDIAPFIIQSQDLYLQPLLGTKFYKRLKDAVLNGTLTSDETEFLDEYVSSMLIQRAFALSIPFIKYKIADKGILSGSSETASDTDLDEVKYLIGKVEDAAEFYAQRVREFLFDNISMFEDYLNPGIKGMMPSRRSQYTAGLTIPARPGSGLLKYTYPYDQDCSDFYFWAGPVVNRN